MAKFRTSHILFLGIFVSRQIVNCENVFLYAFIIVDELLLYNVVVCFISYYMECDHLYIYHFCDL